MRDGQGIQRLTAIQSTTSVIQSTGIGSSSREPQGTDPSRREFGPRVRCTSSTSLSSATLESSRNQHLQCHYSELKSGCLQASNPPMSPGPGGKDRSNDEKSE